MRVRVRLLGGFVVEQDGVPIPAGAWDRRRPADVLKVVGSARGGRLHREQAIDALWPDKEPATGANNLYRALHDLRRIVGAEVVVLDKGVLHLAPGVAVDVLDLEAGLDASDPDRREAALALYAGDLCPDDPYAEPLAARRDMLRRRFVDAALAAARRAGGRGDETRALELLRRVLATSAECEEAHRGIMRLLAEQGRCAEALEQYGACARALRHLDAEPSAATRAVYEQIRRGEVGLGVSLGGSYARIARRLTGTSSPAQIRGRMDELARIADFVAEEAGVLLMTGEGGVGKTRLAVEAARLAGERGGVLLAGSCTELEGMAPYAPFVEALTRGFRAEGLPTGDNPFANFQPGPGGSTEEARLRLFHAVETALARAAAAGSVFLLVDDLQLADASSLQLFHYLARATRMLPLLLVATCRDEDGRGAYPALCANLLRERLARRLAVPRLGREETALLVADVLGRAPAAESVGRIYALAEGNPFYVEEITRTLEETGEIQIPDELADAVRERVRRLPPEAAAYLAAASVVGQRFEHDLVARVAGVGGERALGALESAQAARLLEEDERRHRFRHTLAREAIYDGLARPRRIQLHGAAATALEDKLPASADAVAHHWLAAEQPARALPHLLAAGQYAAERIGFSEAIGFFDEALAIMDDLGVPAGPERFQVACASGQLLVAVSAQPRAVERLDAAAALARPDGWRPPAQARAQARRCAACACINAGDLAGARARLAAAMTDLAELDGSHAEHVEVLYYVAQLEWHEGHHAEAYRAAEECLQRAEALGDATLLARAYEMLALACHSLGDWRAGAGFEDRRTAIAGGPLDVAHAFDVHL